jgi:putative serine protease PepD
MGNVDRMTEHETNPQRHETPSSPEPSHRPADGSFAGDAAYPGSAPARDESEPATAQQPPVSPWQQPQPQPQPQPQHPYSYPQTQQWQQPAYGAEQPAYGAEQPAYGAEQPAYGAEQPAYGAEQPAYGVAGQPAWAQPVATDTRPAGTPGRGRKIFVAGAAAVLIALAGGGIGAATVLAMDGDSGNSAVATSNSAVTRVVDRSSLAQIAAAVQDSVVSITTQSGEGSGVILTADGYIVTNNHVVSTAQGDTVNVIFADGKKATATIVGTDPRTDLAVIKASGVSGLKISSFGDSSKMQVGDTVLALGSPLGLEGSVTAGIISAKDRTIQTNDEQGQEQTPQNPFGRQDPQGQVPQSQGGVTSMSGLLQTDAPINPGNSGGALVNINGEVIGINSAIATSGDSTGNIGLGFAIPSNKAKQVADQLMAGKKVSHPALGVSVAEAEGGGALVRTVTEGGAAAKAGIQQGDVITSVNGKAINDSDDLVGIVQSASVGDKVTIVFTRDGAQKTVTATLAEAG